ARRLPGQEARVQGRAARQARLIEVRTLTDGGQRAEDVARRIAEFIQAAERSLDVALYDLRLSPTTAELVTGALVDAARRGVAVRVAYNVDHGKSVPVPPPPQADPALIESIPVRTRAIPGVPDRMPHTYVVRGVAVRAWFCPRRGERLAHRIAGAIGSARTRVRIASPVITSGPILGTLAEVASDGRVDLAGVVDLTQIDEVLGQWRANGNAEWKAPSLRAALTAAPFSGKRSTPDPPGAVHDH